MIIWILLIFLDSIAVAEDGDRIPYETKSSTETMEKSLFRSGTPEFISSRFDLILLHMQTTLQTKTQQNQQQPASA